MKLFALRDEANEEAGILAYLEWYVSPRTFFIEVSPEVDLWDLPFILFEHHKRGVLTINAKWSSVWVSSRVVPPERQNIAEVLRANGLDEYDEGRLLELSEGRCAQDACYLVPATTDSLPAWYQARQAGRLFDACALDGLRIAAGFRDGRTVVCDMRPLIGTKREFGRVVREEGVFRRMLIQPGGHGVRWGDSLLVSAEELSSQGEPTPLRAGDLAAAMGQLLCDTAEAAALLGCSRQNISDLVRRGRLTPVRSTTHTMLFLRGDILARMG